MFRRAPTPRPPLVLWEPDPDEGWRELLIHLCPPQAVLEWHSIFSLTPFFSRWCDFHPEMNVFGLYWRYP